MDKIFRKVESRKARQFAREPMTDNQGGGDPYPIMGKKKKKRKRNGRAH